VSSLAAALLEDLEDDDLQALAERLRPLLGIRSSAGESDLLTAQEAADYLRCRNRQRIYDLVHAGEITPERDGKRLLFRRAELDRHTRSRAGR
jgi:excisionase family DNA binding protein